MLVFPRRCGRVAMGVVFVECDVGPGGHLAGRHQLLLDVPAGETRSETFRPLNLPGQGYQETMLFKCYLFIAVSMSKSRAR